MNQKERIGILSRLGDYILKFDDRLVAHMKRASHANGWFTMESQRSALEAIAENYLDEEALESWVASYSSEVQPLTVGIIAAGNIPAVAFHDILAAFISGHKAKVKLSEKDQYLLPFLVKVMTEMDDRVTGLIEFVDKLEKFDAVIATGSNNSARYFEQYFGKYPHIIRKNRNAVALLSGDESETELQLLGNDVFEHFGLGCRNVSSLMVPEGFDIMRLKAPFEAFTYIFDHSKYRNNYDYNLAMAMLNREDYLELGHIILKESDKIISPIGCLYYSIYESVEEAEKTLRERADAIQCVVARNDVSGLRTVNYGEAQSPALDDYADGVDTMEFLTTIGK